MNGAFQVLVPTTLSTQVWTIVMKPDATAPLVNPPRSRLCGVFEAGVARFQCEDCGREHFVPFSVIPARDGRGVRALGAGRLAPPPVAPIGARAASLAFRVE